MTKKMRLAEFLLQRLREIGIKDVFGVPGDFNLEFLDYIENSKNLKWVGTCNELNGAYAADGYARVNGSAALVTTFGVGELSAINGIAGSYAEYVPVVKIVGIPSEKAQRKGAPLHHTLADGLFTHFIEMYKSVTEAQTVLDDLTKAAAEIDRVLQVCYLKKRPVYIGLPCNLVHSEIEVPETGLNLSSSGSDAGAVEEAAERAARILLKSKNPVIVVDICADRHNMGEQIESFVNSTQIPFATTLMGRSTLDETNDLFLGIYSGATSAPGKVQELVEASDCVIRFGFLETDFNSGGFSIKIAVENLIDIHSQYVRVKNSFYSHILFPDFLSVLTQKIKGYQSGYKTEKIFINNKTACSDEQPLTQNLLWSSVGDFLPEKSHVIAEVGTSYFGLCQFPLPKGIKFFAQPLWASIGYSVGCVLGTSLANLSKRNFLFVGDGSFQLTAQEISTIMRHNLNTVVFLINNNGYTIERLIHGPKMSYNDIQNWNYAALPQVFGENCVSTVVKTVGELQNAFDLVKKNQNKLVFVEVRLNSMDAPQNLVQIAQNMEKANRGS